MNIFITGSTGFVGRQLTATLKNLNIQCKVAQRSIKDSIFDIFFVPAIDGSSNWVDAFTNINVIVHLAARVHFMIDEVLDPLAEYRKINVEGTLNLARQAATQGVERFIFVSTIKVNGESTFDGHAFSEVDAVSPEDPYALSKYEAEIGLREIAVQTGMEVVIIRPPLVYGPDVKANFLSLIKLADTSIPLPFGAINNKRSMVYIGNLVDFIIQCIDHPSAANQTFLVCDGEDLSLRSLVMMMRTSLGRPARLVPVPAVLFRIAGRIAGKPEVVDRLVGDLQTDSSKARKLLNWVPPFTVQQGIDATIASYLKCKE